MCQRVWPRWKRRWINSNFHRHRPGKLPDQLMDEAIVNYLNKHANWPQLALAHNLLLAHGFSAAIKWNAPVYMLDGKNLVGLGGFKQHCAVWFFNGVLLNDPQNRLLNAQEGKTQTLRQWRFSAAIHSMKRILPGCWHRSNTPINKVPGLLSWHPSN
ncbi:DUF1801 domain-containing protein [Pseudobowmanella zhangzhouensis]|uniref:DUF1801 domain-containing protein n=1 Tax=Pseudobowmanella zhangzhouensis TaxID=1537679 RepID=UPI0036091A0F